ncbi:hypothetical protein CVS40_11808 [Lucilia cuprina]|nr:hypothetical protein CVS40_11808 [Lucilia cuprina]
MWQGPPLNSDYLHEGLVTNIENLITSRRFSKGPTRKIFFGPDLENSHTTATEKDGFVMKLYHLKTRKI